MGSIDGGRLVQPSGRLDVGTAAQDVRDRARESRARARQSAQRQPSAETAQQRQGRVSAAGRRTDQVRHRERLTLEDLWLRYWALGGTLDLLDLDGFLAGVLPFPADQRVVLVQAVRERRWEQEG